MAIAQSDVGIKLYSSATGAAGSFTPLIDITSVPATGAAQGKLETTVLSSPKKTYIADREDIPDMEFTYNYDNTNLTAVKAVCGIADYQFLVIYGDGSGNLIKGEANTWVEPVSRGSVLSAKLNIIPSASDLKTAAEVTALKSTS